MKISTMTDDTRYNTATTGSFKDSNTGFIQAYTDLDTQLKQVIKVMIVI